MTRLYDEWNRIYNLAAPKVRQMMLTGEIVVTSGTEARRTFRERQLRTWPGRRSVGDECDRSNSEYDKNMSDSELDELERFEALVRGPGWVPDIDAGPDYAEWTGKWYTPTRPDGSGGNSLTLYADDEELLYARYIAALRNAAPRLIRAARRLAVLDREGLVAENEALRTRLREVERERDWHQERAKNQEATVEFGFELADKYLKAERYLRVLAGARHGESIEDAVSRLRGVATPAEDPQAQDRTRRG